MSFLLLSLAVSLLTLLPLARRWQLGVRRVAVAAVVLTLVTGVLTEFVVPSASNPYTTFLDNPGGLALKAGVNWILTVTAALAVLIFRFFRDPDRKVPAGTQIVVSPADGEIVYVKASRNRELPVSTKHGRSYPLEELTKTPLQTKEAVVIGIGLSFLDVHINRAPIAGRITLQRHFPGLFGSMRDPDMVFRNERMTTVIERGDLQVAIVQIASRLVRQIVSFVQENQEVGLGQRFGVIRLGSQVDLVLPLRPGLMVTVKPGDRVLAGESIVARLDAKSVPANRSPHDAADANLADASTSTSPVLAG